MSKKTNEGSVSGGRRTLTLGALCDALGYLESRVYRGNDDRAEGVYFAVGFLEAYFGLDDDSVRTARDVERSRMEAA